MPERRGLTAISNIQKPPAYPSSFYIYIHSTVIWNTYIERREMTSVSVEKLSDYCIFWRSWLHFFSIIGVSQRERLSDLCLVADEREEKCRIIFILFFYSISLDMMEVYSWRGSSQRGWRRQRNSRLCREILMMTIEEISWREAFSRTSWHLSMQRNYYRREMTYLREAKRSLCCAKYWRLKLCLFPPCGCENIQSMPRNDDSRETINLQS